MVDIARNEPGGWRFDIEDYDQIAARAMSPSLLAMAMASDWEIPEVLDFTDILLLENQGREGSCQGQSQSSVGELTHFLETGELLNFSADFAYYRSQFYDGLSGDVGSTLNGGLIVATNEGYLPETLQPYTDRYNPADVPRDFLQHTQQYRIGQYAQLRTYRDIVEWQARGYGGVWWGIRWAPSEGPAGYVNSGSFGRGGHAIHLCGWGQNGQKMQRDADGLPSWLWTKNSWVKGKKIISLNGWSRWSRKVIEMYLSDRYTVCLGVTRMPHLQPRTINWVTNTVI